MGNIYGTNGALPSLKNDDYNADLDTVNIANRLINNPNCNTISLINNYYGGIANGNINRVIQFKQIKGEDIFEEINNYINFKVSAIIERENKIVPTSKEDLLILSYRKKVAQNFIKNLEDDNNEYKEYNDYAITDDK